MNNYFRSILEIVYFLSGPSLVYVAYKALKQIEIAKDHLAVAKKDILIRAERESANLAAKQCEFLINEIIPLVNEIDEIIRSNNYPNIKIDKMLIKEFTKAELLSLPKETLKEIIKMQKALLKENDCALLGKIQNVVNKLEAFSTYFVNGIADEAIAFNAVGKQFCSFCIDYYYVIAIVRNKESKNHYCELVRLYEIWANSLNQIEYELEVRQLAKNMEDITSKMEKIQNNTINIIGK